jgi:hypothetical protein
VGSIDADNALGAQEPVFEPVASSLGVVENGFAASRMVLRLSRMVLRLLSWIRLERVMNFLDPRNRQISLDFGDILVPTGRSPRTEWQPRRCKCPESSITGKEVHNTL